ncbi:MAG TPA: cytochrome c3 family protein [Nitrospirota bacterium]|nr:cytochrome c3 family protein [Nitrospirota bacterium]
MIQKIIRWGAALLWCLSFFPGSGTNAPAGELSEESLSCLSCHGQKGLSVSLRTNETLEAYVNATAFKASVHAPLGCSACHTDYTADNHQGGQGKVFVSREQYALRAAVMCRRCHSADSLKAKPIHAAVLTKESSAPVCTRCHNAHSVTPIAGGKTVAGERRYCLGCHEHALTAVMMNSEPVSLRVDSAGLDASVHGKLSCFDCHFGFSSAEHPKREFRSARELSLANADACRRCHFDKYSKSLDSIHYSMLSQGNLKAPVCTDCHGSHLVSPVQTDKTQTAHTCKKCHGAVYATYASSIHGKALVNEHNTDVPVCIDCHSAHAIQDPRTMDYREKVPDICGQCHANKTLMKKYGLYPGVVNSYLDDFHGLTITLYRQQKDKRGAAAVAMRKALATCIDCHGVHDITSTKGPGTNLVKARLVKQCRQCHAGATESFPDAWLSHYEPSLKNAPLVFIIKLIYHILIPFMLVGLVLQMLLHVWRYTMLR